ncbi:arsenate reductase-like glutaredoxin family protein [Flavobacteriaceae bacterium MAR_2009_75]|nr:arsenate reductase-like glutaredoxin family protein [Flavobacteriaceae bacterium MAR_2009_75]
MWMLKIAQLNGNRFLCNSKFQRKTMKKIYHLSTCDTCNRILKELAPLNQVELQDIKTVPMTESQVEEMAQLAGSYESLFSKRARLYRQQGLHEKQLSEADYKKLILEHYTFLKRPVILIDDQIFTGNSKKTVEAAKEALHS